MSHREQHVSPSDHSRNFCPRRMCTTKQAQNPGQHHEPSNAVEGSSSQVAVLESEDLLASIVACIFDKPSYMTLVYVVSKAFHHAFHHARKMNNGYWRRTNPPPPPRRPLPMRLETTCNGQERACVQRSSKLLPLIKEKMLTSESCLRAQSGQTLLLMDGVALAGITACDGELRQRH